MTNPPVEIVTQEMADAGGFLHNALRPRVAFNAVVCAIA